MKTGLCAAMKIEVKESWEVIAMDTDTTVSEQLFEMIVDVWVTVRGFSFVGAWLEVEVQENSPTLKRTTLATCTTSYTAHCHSDVDSGNRMYTLILQFDKIKNLLKSY